MIIVPSNVASKMGPISVGSVATGTSGATSLSSGGSISWTHNITTENYLVVAISEYAGHESGTNYGWNGVLSATGGVTLGTPTLLAGGYRLGTFRVPISGSGSATIRYTLGAGEVFQSHAACSIAINNLASVYAAGSVGNNSGNHTQTIPTPVGAFALFLQGQAYGSAPSASQYISNMEIMLTSTQRFWINQGTVAVGCYTSSANVQTAEKTHYYNNNTGQWGSTVGMSLVGEPQ